MPVNQHYFQVNHVKAIGAVNDNNILSLSYVVNNDCIIMDIMSCPICAFIDFS